MTDLLNQALTLTVWGMGMTFTAIGALVIGMYVMTAWSKDKTAAHRVDEDPLAVDAEPDVSLNDSEPYVTENQINVQHAEDLNLAAAASVAVALALSLETEAKQHYPAPGSVPTAWDQFVRGRHLSQRSQFEQRKLRK